MAKLQQANVYALEVNGLTVKFPLIGGVFGNVQGYFTAVNNVSFALESGKVLSIVGESGSGKSTLLKALVGLAPMSAKSYKLFGETVTKNTRIHDILQMVFQDPFSSLNPRQTIAEILTAPLISRKIKYDLAIKRAKELLDSVSVPQNALQKFPHEFSGGQRQRICIARSLTVNPKILLCDEVTSALDVSVQAQILLLLNDLRNNLGLSILFVSHDMQVVRAISDNVLVMNSGNIIESGNASDVLKNPKHEYTKKLLSCVPRVSNCSEFRVKSDE